jgi:hypothetical protein
MKTALLSILLLGALFAGCKKEPVLSSSTEVANQKLQSNLWKANRFYTDTDTFEKEYKLIQKAFWAFEGNGVLRQTGWLMVDPTTLKDELVYTYQLEENGTRIRSRYSGFSEDDVWQIVKLRADTLTVKRLSPLFPGQPSSYLEFVPAKRGRF